MREILFRGKRKDIGEWVYGSLMQITYKEENNAIPFRMIFEDKFSFVGGYAKSLSRAVVDPETVGQYTGLKDKNGRRIFEGDIVRHHNGSLYADSDNIELGKVYWDEKYCGWRRTSNGAFHHGCVDNYRISPDCIYEVVGNVHDNPELLGGGAT